jgi:hypothetical protein
MESKKINQLATNVAPQSTDLTIIGDPITGVSKKITWLQVSTLIGTAANLQQVTDNGATTTNPIAIGGLTITGLATGVLKSDSGVISSVPFGAANGVATLGGDGKVPSIQLPSYVDDVVEVANFAALPATGETGKIYITLDNNKVYRWTGSIYVEIAANNAVWGAITGTLSNQTDLQNALNAKQNAITLTTTGTSGASTLVGSTLNIPNYSTDLSGYVPYTGATTNVNLGTFDLTADVITGATGSFASNGSSNTFAINHSSGSGIALNITKGGAGEGLYINKTSGSGNAATITGGVTLLDELHLTTDLADAYIASAATWNAKQNAITLTTTGTSGAATLVGATLNIPNYADQFVGTVTSVGLSSATSGVTIGSSPVTTSGTITLAIATASGSQNGLLSSTDWTTFNGKQAALSGTGFVKISGTTISYDNSTYLTTSSASSTYLPLAGGTLTGALNINLSSGSGLNVASDSVIFRSNTGVGSPRQVVISMGGGSTTTLEAKGYGANYITDFNIKTYNSAGTGFDVFFGTSAGDVGIGNTAPAAKLDVNGTGKFSGNLTVNGAYNVPSTSYFLGNAAQGYRFNNAADTLNLLVIKDNGNVGIATTTPAGLLSIVTTSSTGTSTTAWGTGHVVISPNAGSTTGAALGLGYNNTTGESQIFSLSPTIAWKPLTIYSAGINFNAANGSACVAITSGGALQVSANSNTTISGINSRNTNGDYGYYSEMGANTSNTSSFHFVGAISGVGNKIQICGNGNLQNTNNSYGGISDIKLKENIVDASPKLESLLKVKIRNYNLIGDDKKQLGVIAQELEQIFPSMIDESNDFDKDNNDLGTTTKSVKYSVFVPMLIKAIQEQQAQIEELKAKIK